MQTPPPSVVRLRFRPPAIIFVFFVVLLGWIFFLRWPTFGVPLWDVDEAIHAAVARTLLDGGVLYRDAVDQRTPLTYYAVALLFRVFGENNLWALRAAVAAIIAGTALGLWLLGRRTRGGAAGVWTALVFCALTTNLLFAGDTNAANTEWFVILFTTWGTWCFWRTLDRTDVVSPAITGGLFGLAFLSKQPALLDVAAPILTLGFVSVIGRKRFGNAARCAAGILLGFLAVNAVACAWFAVHGAFGDMVFYTGSYNLLYYGPEVTPLQRLLATLLPFARLWTHYPLVLLALAGGAGLLLVRVAQLRPTADESAGQPWAFYLLTWNATSLAAAAAGGRQFEHYYIQCLPAFALTAGWLLAAAGAWVRRSLPAGRRPSLRTGLAVAPVAFFLAAAAFSVVVSPAASRGRAEYPHDPAMRASRFINLLTTPRERIFVWGYNPDIYLYTDRKPASRFMYCSFQTGLIPWTNLAPGKDTGYAVVPGTMETLLAELDARRPTFIVDCSAGPHRHFSKYPLAKFASLETFVSRHYVEVESMQFVPQGFRLHLVKDSARREPVRLAGGTEGDPAPPTLVGSPLAGPVPTAFVAVGEDAAGRLQRLELRVDDTVVDSVSFQPTRKITVQFAVPFDRLGPGHYRLAARAISANGKSCDCPAMAVTCAASTVSREQLPAFQLPCVTTGLLPLEVRTPFASSVDEEEGHRVIFLHAPSLLSYPLQTDVPRVRGGFGIRPGAYAPSNPAPTDGAEFLVEWVSPRDERRILFDRLLQPRDHPEDRPLQFFTAELPPHAAGGRLEFVITTGPAGSGASDWTFWADLRADTSR